MTSEFRSTVYVFEFVSGGPKNYAYTLIDTVTGRAATVCKVRGITLNYNAKQLVNFDVINAMILLTGEPTGTYILRRILSVRLMEGVLWT